MKKVKLFYTEACPYCVDPINYVKDNNLDVELIDATHDLASKKELFEIGGRMQVPMLSIDGDALFESREILAWLKENM